jgi:hypothetical protein
VGLFSMWRLKGLERSQTTCLAMEHRIVMVDIPFLG